MGSPKKIRIKGLDKVVNPIYLKHMFSNQNTIQIYYGGSSSGKSYSLAQRVIIDCMMGRNYLVLRKVARTIRDSVFSEVSSKINEMGLRKFFHVTDLKITCKLNDAQILFAGLDDPFKMQSIRPKKGPLTDIWIEEATEITYKDYKILTKRQRGESKLKKRFTLSFNPIIKTHWLYKNFFVGLWRDDKQYVEGKDISILKTTYKDNRFLTKQDVSRLEDETDEYYYNVYTLGNWGMLGAVIYKNWKVEAFDKTKFSQYRNGLDWGFEHPFAFVRIAIERAQKKIYICEEIYKTHLTNDKTGAMVKKIAGFEVVWCDSAEPKSIKEYRMMGLMSKAAEKGKGSVIQGIKYLQKFEIVIHPDCINFEKEISQYKRKEDRHGEIMEEPVDKNDDLLDATRYALEYDMKYGAL